MKKGRYQGRWASLGRGREGGARCVELVALAVSNELRLELLEYAAVVVNAGPGIVKFDCSASTSSSEKGLDSIH